MLVKSVGVESTATRTPTASTSLARRADFRFDTLSLRSFQIWPNARSQFFDASRQTTCRKCDETRA